MLLHHLHHGRHSIKSLFFVLREDGTGIGPALPSGALALALASLVYGIAIRHHVHGRYNLLGRQWVGGGFLIIKPFENTKKYWEVVGTNLSIVYHACINVSTAHEMDQNECGEGNLDRDIFRCYEKKIDYLTEHDLRTRLNFNTINYDFWERNDQIYTYCDYQRPGGEQGLKQLHFRDGEVYLYVGLQCEFISVVLTLLS
ncbi:uncharacterized protein LOC142554234 [Primulina tabacum]|uniref:uncharacterized protein LOC142554234 n=1 Tax=Primulina tabacum TaxID=48773 RepID=UPI003F59973E